MDNGYYGLWDAMDLGDTADRSMACQAKDLGR